MAWGRNASIADVGLPPQRTRYGRRSVGLAFAAPIIVVAAFTFLVSMPKETAAPWPDIATFAALGSYAIVAPILHIAGFVFGLMAVGREGDNKALGVVGIVLNIALVSIGLLLGYFALSGIGAYT